MINNFLELGELVSLFTTLLPPIDLLMFSMTCKNYSHYWDNFDGKTKTPNLHLAFCNISSYDYQKWVMGGEINQAPDYYPPILWHKKITTLEKCLSPLYPNYPRGTKDILKYELGTPEFQMEDEDLFKYWQSIYSKVKLYHHRGHCYCTHNNTLAKGYALTTDQNDYYMDDYKYHPTIYLSLPYHRIFCRVKDAIGQCHELFVYVVANLIGQKEDIFSKYQNHIELNRKGESIFYIGSVDFVKYRAYYKNMLLLYKMELINHRDWIKYLTDCNDTQALQGLKVCVNVFGFNGFSESISHRSLPTNCLKFLKTKNMVSSNMEEVLRSRTDWFLNKVIYTPVINGRFTSWNIFHQLSRDQLLIDYLIGPHQYFDRFKNCDEYITVSYHHFVRNEQKNIISESPSPSPSSSPSPNDQADHPDHPMHHFCPDGLGKGYVLGEKIVRVIMYDKFEITVGTKTDHI